MKRWRDYFITLFLAVVCALLAREFLLTAYKVPTGSMQPTLKPGDFIFASRVAYAPWAQSESTTEPNGQPVRGDLVVYTYPHSPETTYVKRVIGLPGDRLQIVKGRISLNEQELEYNKSDDQKKDNPNEDLFQVYDEAYLSKKWRVIFQKAPENKDFGPIVVPPGEVFVLGDNRDASDDSRYWGTVPLSRISGKVILIWLSLDNQAKSGGPSYPSVRWERVFSTPD
jgi:signal peptidase I